MCVCVCECVRVCVCERERESVSVCVCGCCFEEKGGIQDFAVSMKTVKGINAYNDVPLRI